MLYTLMGLVLMNGATGPMDTVDTIEGMHLEQSVCVARAKVLAEELGGAKCRPEKELDPDSPYENSNTKIQLPSGRVIDLFYTRGYWFYPMDLTDPDRELVEQWTGFVYSRDDGKRY
jgi:hypothetical protein